MSRRGKGIERRLLGSLAGELERDEALAARGGHVLGAVKPGAGCRLQHSSNSPDRLRKTQAEAVLSHVSGSPPLDSTPSTASREINYLGRASCHKQKRFHQ